MNCHFNDNKNLQTDKLRLTGAFLGVEKQLASLAPARGSAFVKTESRYAARCGRNGGQDGLLGGLLLDCLTGGVLGSAFAEAANLPAWAGEIDFGTTAEIADEYWLDRRREQAGTALGDKGAISPAFGRHAQPRAADGLSAPADTWQRAELATTHAILRRRLDQAPAFG